MLEDCGLNSGFRTCKAGALQLEPHLQVHFAVVILEINYLPRLPLNYDPLDLSLPGS
jgi:hypothetical protein